MTINQSHAAYKRGAHISIMADEFLYSGKKLSKIKNKIHNLGTHLGWFEEKIDHTINKVRYSVKIILILSVKRSICLL